MSARKDNLDKYLDAYKCGIMKDILCEGFTESIKDFMHVYDIDYISLFYNEEFICNCEYKCFDVRSIQSYEKNSKVYFNCEIKEIHDKINKNDIYIGYSSSSKTCQTYNVSSYVKRNYEFSIDDIVISMGMYRLIRHFVMYEAQLLNELFGVKAANIARNIYDNNRFIICDDMVNNLKDIDGIIKFLSIYDNDIMELHKYNYYKGVLSEIIEKIEIGYENNENSNLFMVDLPKDDRMYWEPVLINLPDIRTYHIMKEHYDFMNNDDNIKTTIDDDIKECVIVNIDN